MRVVIDCNVLVSAARIAGVCRQVIDNVVRWHDIVLSDPVLAEYETVAERPSVVSHKYAYEDARAFWLSARRDDEQWRAPREEEQRSRRPKGPADS